MFPNNFWPSCYWPGDFWPKGGGVGGRGGFRGAGRQVAQMLYEGQLKEWQMNTVTSQQTLIRRFRHLARRRKERELFAKENERRSVAVSTVAAFLSEV